MHNCTVNIDDIVEACHNVRFCCVSCQNNTCANNTIIGSIIYHRSSSVCGCLFNLRTMYFYLEDAIYAIHSYDDVKQFNHSILNDTIIQSFESLNLTRWYSFVFRFE